MAAGNTEGPARGFGLALAVGGAAGLAVKGMRETNSPRASERLASLASRRSLPPRRKRWKAGAAYAGGKQTRSAALRSRTEAVAGRRTDVVRPSSARTGRTTERCCAAITNAYVRLMTNREGNGGYEKN